MTNEIEEIRSSPIVPTVQIQLDIGGRAKDLTLRLSVLAVRNIEAERKTIAARDAEAAGKEVGALDNFQSTALVIKYCLFPRDHGMSLEDILDAMSLESMAELSRKIVTLMGKQATTGNPTKEAAATPAAMPKASKKRRSRMNSGGNLKPSLASVSTSRLLNSGTPTPAS